MSRALVHRSDFERLLAVRPVSRSAHFALHYVAGRPRGEETRPTGIGETQLSTGDDEYVVDTVDNYEDGVWYGVMVPRRQARRAVTRNLIKRQVRALFEGQHARMRAGLWLVRVRQGFALAEFPAAASASLRQTVRRELETLLEPARRVGISRPASARRAAKAP